MTLKQYFKENGISASPDDRSRIGILLSEDGAHKGHILEDGHFVKVYHMDFLQSKKTFTKIMSYFNQ